DELRRFVHAVDENCAGFESSPELSSEGIARRRTEAGAKALRELERSAAVASAEKAVKEHIDMLEKQIPQISAPAEVADVMLAAEIRAHAAAHPSPIDFATKSIGDERTLGALLYAPAYLSGLTEEEQKVVRRRAREALDPERTQLQQRLALALAE